MEETIPLIPYNLSTIKKRGMSAKHASLFDNHSIKCLFHNKLRRGRTSVHEVDTSGEVADVDGVDTNMAFSGHDDLAHHIEDGDVGILVEGDVELVNSGVRIDVHQGVVAHLFFHTVVFGEEFGEVEGEGLVEVVVSDDVAA